MANALEAKVVLLGDTGVGKTSLVTRFVQKEYSRDTKQTIGASFWTKRIILDKKKITLQIWDTAGQERFRAMTPLYYRGSQAAILTLDITDEESFVRVQSWVDELKKNVDDQKLANKCDLGENYRVVSQERIKDYAESIGAIAIETSAKTKVGVEELFLTVVRQLLATDAAKPAKAKATHPPHVESVDNGCCSV